jgi:hypothetical protein
MPADRPFRAGRVVAARFRLGVARSNGRRVGERDRQVHFVALPGDEPAPAVLKALCGDLLELAEAELLDGISGMPCVSCFARAPHLMAGTANRRRSA